jgi:GTP cyclohydrolase I
MSGLYTQKEKDRYENAISHMTMVLACLGFNLEDENFTDTPKRFVKYLQEYTKGEGNAEKHLQTGFAGTDNDYKGMVVQTNIPFRTICPHHLLPVIGRAHLGYIPTHRVTGLSKLTRIVQDVGCEKPRMQEEITDILADMLHKGLEAKGAIVVISAEHMCMAGRGVKAHDVPTLTSSVRGNFLVVPAAREEFFDLLRVAHIKGV